MMTHIHASTAAPMGAPRASVPSSPAASPSFDAVLDAARSDLERPVSTTLGPDHDAAQKKETLPEPPQGSLPAEARTPPEQPRPAGILPACCDVLGPGGDEFAGPASVEHPASDDVLPAAVAAHIGDLDTGTAALVSDGPFAAPDQGRAAVSGAGHPGADSDHDTSQAHPVTWNAAARSAPVGPSADEPQALRHTARVASDTGPDLQAGGAAVVTDQPDGTTSPAGSWQATEAGAPGEHSGVATGPAGADAAVQPAPRTPPVAGAHQPAGVAAAPEPVGTADPTGVRPPVVAVEDPPQPDVSDAAGRVADVGRSMTGAPRPAADGTSATGGVTAPLAAAEASPAFAAQRLVPDSMPPEAAAPVLDQIVRSMRMHWARGVSEARISLRPEHLGNVSVLLRVEAGVVTAVVRADSAQVQEWVLSHQQSLRQQLEAAGLRLDDLEVEPDAERRHHQAPPDQDPPQPRRRSDGSTPQFQLVV